MPGGDPPSERDRQGVRQARRERARRRYELLEQARKERRGHVRDVMRESTRLPGRPSRRALIILTVVVAAVIAIVSLRHEPSRAPELLRSCTTPAIAVSEPAGGGPVGQFAITGPAAGTYVVAVDAKTVTVHGDSADATPAGAVAVAIRRGLSGCASSGPLPDVSPGAHEVQLFRDGDLVAQTRLAEPVPSPK